jgi:hypothetical protein
MRGLKPAAFRVSQRQFAWACVGVAILVLVAFIASGNLRDIYKAQPDFVLGSLLGLVGYAFAKTVTRTGAERAVEELHQAGIVQRMRLIQRDCGAALRRLTTFYHAQAESIDFLGALDLYEVIIDDVDEALTSADYVMQRLGLLEERSVTYEVKPVTRQLLLRHARSVRESLNRGRHTQEWLATHLPPAEHPQAWSVFGNLVADLLKAHFAMRMLCAEPMRVAPEEQAIEMLGYLAAAQLRADEFRAVLRAAGQTAPGAFETLVKDLASARDALTGARIELPDAELAQASS